MNLNTLSSLAAGSTIYTSQASNAQAQATNAQSSFVQSLTRVQTGLPQTLLTQAKQHATASVQATQAATSALGGNTALSDGITNAATGSSDVNGLGALLDIQI